MPQRLFILTILCLHRQAVAAPPTVPFRPVPDGGAAVEFSKHVQPLLAKYCFSCHSGADPKGGVALDAYPNEPAALPHRLIWKQVARNLESGAMPPKGKPQPSVVEHAVIRSWIETRALKMDCSEIDPGRVTIHRLNRVEYDNTVRDLLGIEFHASRDFPADDSGSGFDNVADILSTPPILVERYLAAAELAAKTAIVTSGTGTSPAEKGAAVDHASKPLPESHRRLIVSKPASAAQVAECARAILKPFLMRAFRRPPADDEVSSLVALVERIVQTGDEFERGIQIAVQAVLVSPHFLFRIEAEPPPGDPAKIRVLDDFELASRLSYFLWSSMPDDELFGLASKGSLRKSGNLESQVRRMLKDSKSYGLVENFAAQWLQLRNLESVSPSKSHYPQFSEELKQAMETETRMFVAAIIQEDRSIAEFLNSDFTFLNELLAKHYGIAGVAGNEFRRVSLMTDQRGGLLGHASILLVTSNPTRTSPVKRGKWILEAFLGAPPPPPPPNVPNLDARARTSPGSVRRRLEQHRKNPACISCHLQMDELGLGLENYDGIGAWRTKDGVFRVDPSGTLPGGVSFKSPAELKQILRSRQSEFRRCLTEKLLTFALGRSLDDADQCTIDLIVRELASGDDRFSELVLAIIHSDPFQKRRTRPETP